MLKLLSRFFKQNPREVKSLLTEEQAWTIAEKAVEGSDYVGLMTFSTLKDQGDKLTWEVCSATIGAGMIVLIDDETGLLISCEKILGR